MRDKILNLMKELAEENGWQITSDIKDDTVLLESGLDSFGFAVLVVRLEEVLGYDPFTIMEEPYYPRTFADFVDVYEKYAP